MAHRLILARELAGLSVGQAQHLLVRHRGWHPGQLQGFERGEVGLSPAGFETLAELYEVNVPWLRGEVPELAPESVLESAIICGGVASDLDKESLRRLLTATADGSGKFEVVSTRKRYAGPPEKL